jgi:hypothetical protein
MILGSEIIKLRGSLDYFRNSWITKFHYFAGLDIDQVIVLSTLERSFKLCYILPELMFDNQVAVKQ